QPARYRPTAGILERFVDQGNYDVQDTLLVFGGKGVKSRQRSPLEHPQHEAFPPSGWELDESLVEHLASPSAVMVFLREPPVQEGNGGAVEMIKGADDARGGLPRP